VLLFGAVDLVTNAIDSGASDAGHDKAFVAPHPFKSFSRGERMALAIGRYYALGGHFAQYHIQGIIPGGSASPPTWEPHRWLLSCVLKRKSRPVLVGSFLEESILLG